MVKNIEKIGRIIKIGSSKGIIIEKDILEYLHLDVGDAVKLLIEKIEELEPRTTEKTEKEGE